MKINGTIVSCAGNFALRARCKWRGELRSMYGTVVSCLRMKWKTQYSLITSLENIH